MGGSIYYNKNRPTGLQSNLFSNNLATYGDNIASYPYSVIVKNYTKTPVASGQMYNGEVLACIIDAEGQVITTDNSS